MPKKTHPDDEGSYFIANEPHARTGQRAWVVRKQDDYSQAGYITVGRGASQDEALALSRGLNRKERAQKKLNPEQFQRHSFS